MSSLLRSTLFVFCSLFAYGTALSQATASAKTSSGSAYPVFAAAGFGVEGPDESSPNCQSGSASAAGNHKAFGPHITQVADATLKRNVFAFASHIGEDSDRCEVYDRVRIEVKGGPLGSSVPDLEHNYGDTSHYRWQFRLDEGFVGSNSFTHLFQNKAQGGQNSNQPIVTLTARREVLELIHAREDNSATDQILTSASTQCLPRQVGRGLHPPGPHRHRPARGPHRRRRHRHADPHLPQPPHRSVARDQQPRLHQSPEVGHLPQDRHGPAR